MKPVQRIEYKGIGDYDKVPYQKIDLVKVCRLGSKFALSFYQLDYQALVNAITKLSDYDPKNVKPMPVVKIVTDYEGFKMVQEQINEIAERYEKEQAKKKLEEGNDGSENK